MDRAPEESPWKLWANKKQQAISRAYLTKMTLLAQGLSQWHLKAGFENLLFLLDCGLGCQSELVSWKEHCFSDVFYACEDHNQSCQA